MRAGLASRIEPGSNGVLEYSRTGWLQAGFSSFAYRLAHLRCSRGAMVGVLSIAFLLI
jgi:hypothetical protein